MPYYNDKGTWPYQDTSTSILALLTEAFGGCRLYCVHFNAILISASNVYGPFGTLAQGH